jgi:hypothetical protein
MTVGLWAVRNNFDGYPAYESTKNQWGIIQQNKSIDLIALMFRVCLEVIGRVEDHLPVLRYN